MSREARLERSRERIAAYQDSARVRVERREAAEQTAKERRQRVPFTGRLKKDVRDPNKPVMWWMD